jgi:transcriptional regulator with GAF, ATPase, and Fis domain
MAGSGSDDTSTDVQPEALARVQVHARARPELSWTDASGAHHLRIGKRATIGSAPGVDIEIADSAVSRIHCELELHDDGLWIRDLRSTNGTFVGAIRVERARLDEGMRARVGSTEIAVSYGSKKTLIELWPDDHFGPMLGESLAMRELFALLSRAAASDATVLIEGETGTGKELVARAIHEQSRRAAGPYVVVDCAAIAETLLEAELFGHGRGAFTGAVGARNGALLEAHGGTLFLDEIGELSLGLQPKLLRFLESRTVRRIGETQVRSVDVRVLAATHRNLRAMVNEGAFREDLYFRLAVLPVHVPPLRDRRDDIPLLVERFAPGAPELTPERVRELMHLPWLGNVRELRNFVERATTFGMAAALRMEGGARPESDPGEPFPDVRIDEPFKEIRERWTSRLERDYLVKALAHHQGNVSAVAKAAGLDRSYVYRLMLKHGL